MPGFEEFRDTLQGVIPMPISGFICHKGQLSAEQLHDLAEVLALNVAKGGFRLEGCKLGDTGAKVIAEALQYNTKIITVELPGNDITPVGVQAFIDMMFENFVITTLDFDDNPCMDTYVSWSMELDGYIIRNRRGWTNDDMALESPAPSTIMPDTTNSDLMAQSPFPTPCNTVKSRKEAGILNFTPPRSTLSTRSTRYVRSSLFARSPLSARSQLSARSPTLATSPRSARSLLSPGATARSPSRTRSPSLDLWSPSLSRAVLQPFDHMENVAAVGEAGKAGCVQKPAGHDLAASLWQDKRLLKLEKQFDIIMAEMDTVKERAFGLQGWKQQVDDASTQVASVLGHLNTGVEDIRSSLLAYKRWQGQVETAGQDVQGALGTLTSSWQDMRDRVAQLARDHQDAEIMQQEQAQQQMETVLDDIAQIKEDQENMAVETGVSEGISGVEMWNRIVRLEEDAVYFEEVTGRLEKYVEEMLRTMLGDLDRGQRRLHIEVDKLSTRFAKIEMRQDAQDQLIQALLARVQRTEAALDLTSPPPPAPAPTHDDTPQQLPSAGSLLQAFQEDDIDTDSGSDCEDDLQSDSAAASTVAAHSTSHQGSMPRLVLLPVMDTAEVASPEVQAPRGQLHSPASHQQDDVTTELSSCSHSDDCRASDSDTSVAAETATAQITEQATTSTADIDEQTQACATSAVSEATSTSTSTADSPNQTAAAPACSSEQAAASDTCLSRSSEASASGQDASASGTGQAVAVHLGLGRSTEVSSSGRYVQPDAASALQSARLVESRAQQADQGSHGSGLQDELVCRSDGFTTQRDMPAASQEQYEGGSVQFGITDEQPSGSSSVADAAAVQRPKRRFKNFFRFRPADNKFL